MIFFWSLAEQGGYGTGGSTLGGICLFGNTIIIISVFSSSKSRADFFPFFFFFKSTSGGAVLWSCCGGEMSSLCFPGFCCFFVCFSGHSSFSRSLSQDEFIYDFFSRQFLSCPIQVGKEINKEIDIINYKELRGKPR